jgi:hypothetical protein
MSVVPGTVYLITGIFLFRSQNAANEILSSLGVVIWLQRKLIFWHKETVAEELFE